MLNIVDNGFVTVGNTDTMTVMNAGAVHMLSSAPGGLVFSLFGEYSQLAGSTRVDLQLISRQVDFLGGSLTGIGIVAATGGPIVIGADATVAPGDSTGTLTFAGDV